MLLSCNVPCRKAAFCLAYLLLLTLSAQSPPEASEGQAQNSNPSPEQQKELPHLPSEILDIISAKARVSLTRPRHIKGKKNQNEAKQLDNRIQPMLKRWQNAESSAYASQLEFWDKCRQIVHVLPEHKMHSPNSIAESAQRMLDAVAKAMEARTRTLPHLQKLEALVASSAPAEPRKRYPQMEKYGDIAEYGLHHATTVAYTTIVRARWLRTFRHTDEFPAVHHEPVALKDIVWARCQGLPLLDVLGSNDNLRSPHFWTAERGIALIKKWGLDKPTKHSDDKTCHFPAETFPTLDPQGGPAPKPWTASPMSQQRLRQCGPLNKDDQFRLLKKDNPVRMQVSPNPNWQCAKNMIIEGAATWSHETIRALPRLTAGAQGKGDSQSSSERA